MDLDAAPAATAGDTQAADPVADAQPSQPASDLGAPEQGEAPKRRRRTAARKPAADAPAVRAVGFSSGLVGGTRMGLTTCCSACRRHADVFITPHCRSL